MSLGVELKNDGGRLSPTRLLGWGLAGLVALILLAALWPFASVPTGHRGVVTQFGRIVGIEGEGLAVLPPWQKLSVFNVRSEQADVEGAEGSTSDQQPVKVSLTVRAGSRGGSLRKIQPHG